MAAVDLSQIKAMVGRLKRRPVDVLGLDLASSGVKAVRLKKIGEQISVVAADILPAVRLPELGQDAAGEIPALELPKEFQSKHASLALSGENSVVKLLNFPAHGGNLAEEVESRIVESMGLEDAEQYRIGYKIVTEGHGKAESRVLAVAVPDITAAAACSLIPIGLPAPFSIEVSGLATMTAFLAGPGAEPSDEACGLLEFGAKVSYFAIFRGGVPLLIRKFDFGSNAILESVQKSLGIDRATAEGILCDGSFDVSQQVGETLNSVTKQVIISRDFVERRENCHVSKVFACGGVTRSRDLLLEMKSALGFDVNSWNPFDAVAADAGSIPEQYQGSEDRFAAALGAAIATLQET
ncbi:MAG: hypothetical protein E4H02_00110 [Lentisphaerales bacterium]|jgi:Tfp pilus assembly PilM family ATPase|nr:MAG: hypothetical protein E4H02_00110 [Lentisphaerales bacterium]